MVGKLFCPYLPAPNIPPVFVIWYMRRSSRTKVLPKVELGRAHESSCEPHCGKDVIELVYKLSNSHCHVRTGVRNQNKLVRRSRGCASLRCDAMREPAWPLCKLHGLPLASGRFESGNMLIDCIVSELIMLIVCHHDVARPRVGIATRAAIIISASQRYL